MSLNGAHLQFRMYAAASHQYVLLKDTAGGELFPGLLFWLLLITVGKLCIHLRAGVAFLKGFRCRRLLQLISFECWLIFGLCSAREPAASLAFGMSSVQSVLLHAGPWLERAVWIVLLTSTIASRSEGQTGQQALLGMPSSGALQPVGRHCDRRGLSDGCSTQRIFLLK